MFWGEFCRPLAALDRCTLNKGAFAFKIVRGALKWPLKGGSRLIQVAATAGLTVLKMNFIAAFQFQNRLSLQTLQSVADPTLGHFLSLLSNL